MDAASMVLSPIPSLEAIPLTSPPAQKPLPAPAVPMPDFVIQFKSGNSILHGFVHFLRHCISVFGTIHHKISNLFSFLLINLLFQYQLLSFILTIFICYLPNIMRIRQLVFVAKERDELI